MTTSCKICQESAETVYKGHVGYKKPAVFDILHCKNCKTAFVDPPEIDEELYNTIYSRIAEVPGYQRYYKYSEEISKESDPLAYLANKEDIYWAVAKHLSTVKDKNVRILEVGCGFGYLTYALAQAGYDIKGMDISQVAVDAATKRYGEFFFCADVYVHAKEKGPSYDCIILTEVIEHVPEPKRFLEALKELLLPGGELIVTTPNRSLFPEDVLWETELPPIHLWWFSEHSIKHLAKELQLSAQFTDFRRYNLKEHKEGMLYTQWLRLIGGYKPTRDPILSETNEIIPWIPPPQPPITQQSLPARILKKILRKMRLMSIIDGVRALQARLAALRCELWVRFLHKQRPIMCVVLKRDQ